MTLRRAVKATAAQLGGYDECPLFWNAAQGRWRDDDKDQKVYIVLAKQYESLVKLKKDKRK